jgi:hypothetical protein
VRTRKTALPSILQDLGLNSLSANGGYAQAVTKALLAQLASGRESNALERLSLVQTFACLNGRLLFETLRPFVAEAILKPFLREGNVSQEIRNRVLQVVLPLYRDPRLSPGLWASVDVALRDLVVRWLSQQSLRQFLEIVDDTADLKMWPYRRAFWEGVYSYYEERGLPVEAWVAFGDRGARRARSSFGSSASFGRLTGERKQVEPGHAVLLLKIGNVFIADWSHNGKCNLWLDSNVPNCPKLYRGTYGSDEVRVDFGRDDWEGPHAASLRHGGSDNYRWQDKIAEKLANRLRQRVPKSRYLVR